MLSKRLIVILIIALLGVFSIACEDQEAIRAERRRVQEARQATEAKEKADEKAEWLSTLSRYRDAISAAAVHDYDFGWPYKDRIPNQEKELKEYQELAAIPVEQRTFRQTENYFGALGGLESLANPYKTDPTFTNLLPRTPCSDAEFIDELKKDYFTPGRVIDFVNSDKREHNVDFTVSNNTCTGSLFSHANENREDERAAYVVKTVGKTGGEIKELHRQARIAYYKALLKAVRSRDPQLCENADEQIGCGKTWTMFAPCSRTTRLYELMKELKCCHDASDDSRLLTPEMLGTTWTDLDALYLTTARGDVPTLIGLFRSADPDSTGRYAAQKLYEDAAGGINIRSAKVTPPLSNDEVVRITKIGEKEFGSTNGEYVNKWNNLPKAKSQQTAATPGSSGT